MRSRHIPKHIDIAVKEHHFFECAWCGQKLIERHHIVDFSQGGEHSVDNLILLCPSCHTQVHRNEISHGELMTRKSTHVKGEHLSAGVNFELTRLKIRIGGGIMEEVPVPIQCREINIIEIRRQDHQFFISTRFYNIHGELIFWMSSNRYWTKSYFEVTLRDKYLKVYKVDDPNIFIEIIQVNDFLEVSGTNYLAGQKLSILPDRIIFGTHRFIATSMSHVPIGYSFN